MLEYDSDDSSRKSPGLQEVKVTLLPSLPYIPRQKSTPPLEFEIGRRRARRQKTRPTLGDGVLISFMAPDLPYLAKEVSERALNSGSEEELEGEGRRPDYSHTDRYAAAERHAGGGNAGVGLMQTAAAAVAVADSRPARSDQHDGGNVRAAAASAVGTGHHGPNGSSAPTGHEYSATYGHRRAVSNGVGGAPNGSPELLHRLDSMPRHSVASSGSDEDGRARAVGSVSPKREPPTSPDRWERPAQQRRVSPEQTLPAMQNGHPPERNGDKRSPQPERNLPSFRQVAKLAGADQANGTRQNGGYSGHRHSVSAASGQSVGSPPMSSPRHFSISHGSPPSQFRSIGQAVSNGGEVTSPDSFPAGAGLQIYSLARRQSQPADGVPPPLSASLPSASTADGFAVSPDSFSPGAHAARNGGQHLDGAVAQRMLPLPQPSISQSNSLPPGTFRCDHPGCNAAPFQTQYLLNSHANVHSQKRPHYCPVAGCTRGVGGKGFKRKNEMIRHGLVHDSPGYACPFCPEREHKYPRPDNLQRHVRVHHTDKDKEDQQLRDVLAQRPEGGSRGRRRRAGS